MRVRKVEGRKTWGNAWEGMAQLGRSLARGNHKNFKSQDQHGALELSAMMKVLFICTIHYSSY